MESPRELVAANRSAAPKAPRGIQRPKMRAASAMNPRPLIMPRLERAAVLEREPGTRQAREEAAQDDVPIAQRG